MLVSIDHFGVGRGNHISLSRNQLFRKFSIPSHMGNASRCPGKLKGNDSCRDCVYLFLLYFQRAHYSVLFEEAEW